MELANCTKNSAQEHCTEQIGKNNSMTECLGKIRQTRFGNTYED